jgi:hypothetical protein
VGRWGGAVSGRDQRERDKASEREKESERERERESVLPASASCQLLA